MRASGLFFLSKTKPETSEVEGEFALTLAVYDDLGRAGKERCRVRWTGTQAQAFWQRHQRDLLPGAVLRMELERLRAFAGTTFPPQPELRARVISAELVPKRTALPAAA